MKTHFDSAASSEHIRLQGEAPCGAGRGVSQYGIEATSNTALVNCKRCLARLKAEAEEKDFQEAMRKVEADLAEAEAEAQAVVDAQPTMLKIDDKVIVQDGLFRKSGKIINYNDSLGFAIEFDDGSHPEFYQGHQLTKVVQPGPQDFWDVREAEGYVERQAFTRHNISLALERMQAAGMHDGRRIVDGLVQERDILLHTKGYENKNGTDQYLAGRIAGIEFALAMFGVKF